MEAVLRRYGKINRRLTFADVEIDTVSRTVNKAGKTIDLTVKEFDLLVELVQNKNVALYRDRLYEKVWGVEFSVIHAHLIRIYKDLEKNLAGRST